VVKTILYKRTIVLGTSIDFWKDLRRSEPRGDSGGSEWRKEAVSSHAVPPDSKRERKCADTFGTVPVPWAVHFRC